MSHKTDRLTFLALTSITLACGAATLWLTRSFNPLRGDSPGYLYFDPTRTVGYPAFLALVRLVTGQVALAVSAQMLVLVVSLIWLGWSFHQQVRRPIYTVAFQLLLIANAGMWFASAFLMSEALSTAFVALWTAQLLRMLRQPNSGYGWLIAIPSVAIMIRPSLLPLLFGSLTLAPAAQPVVGRGKTLALFGAGALAAWAATPLAQLLVHGSAYTTSPLARGVLQHTLFCDAGTRFRDQDAQFVEAASSSVRRYIDSAPPSLHEQLRREYSTPLRFGLIIPVLGRRHHLDMGSQVDPYLARIAEQRVRANPLCYGESVANEYARLAAFDTDPTAAEARDANAFIRGHRPVELAQYPVLAGDERLARQAGTEVHRPPSGLNAARQKLHVAGDVPMIALLPFRLLYGAGALIGAAAILAFLFRRRLPEEVQPVTRVAAALGLALHGILLITAIVEIGFYRYLVPCWPIICALIALAAIAVRQFRRRPALSPSSSRRGRQPCRYPPGGRGKPWQVGPAGRALQR